MGSINKRLTLLSESERYALYGLPDLNSVQRIEYLNLTVTEQELALSRPNLSAQFYCALQIGYFKAKQTFFRVPWEEIPSDDIQFLQEHYFPGEALARRFIRKYECLYVLGYTTLQIILLTAFNALLTQNL